MFDLRVEGLVKTPRSFAYADLATLDGQVADVGTVVEGRAGSGVSFPALIAAVGKRAGATHATLEATDGSFTASLPLEDLANGVVTYKLGDGPLPDAKGGPVRFLMPHTDACRTGGVDACANVKGLGRIELTAGPGPDTRPT